MRIMWLIFYAFVGIVFSSELTSNFYYEESCERGYCVLESECSHPVDDHYKTLCPSQKKQGAVCCKDFPANRVNCFQSHNACIPKSQCPSFLNSGRKGCTNDTTCCILVH